LTGTDRTLDELGYYLLAGAGGEGPATLMDEARRGEELGFGTAFISERWNVRRPHLSSEPRARSPTGCRSPPQQPITTPVIR